MEAVDPSQPPSTHSIHDPTHSKVGDAVVSHPASLAKDVDELMKVAADNNDLIHAIIKPLIDAVNGLHEPGPIKRVERVVEKSRAEYKVDERANASNELC